MAASSEFRKYFSKKGLKKLFVEEIRYKSARGIDQVSTRTFQDRLLDNLNIIHRKVHNGTYQFSQYREKLISRGAERTPRVISIPTIRDKLVQKALAEILQSSFGGQIPLLHVIINNVISTYRSGVYESVLRLDVKDFYPSILHADLIKEVRKKIRKKEIINLINNGISRKTVSRPNRNDKNATAKGVPQGLSISNILANIYLSQIDAKYSRKPTLKYFRYVDDILIFCNEIDIQAVHADLEWDCINLGLNLHKEDNASKSKSGKVVDGFSYLGYEFKNSKITVRKKSVDRLRESIIKVFTNHKYSNTKDIDFLGWALNIRITGCIFKKSKYGWLFFFSQIDDLSLLGELDHFIQTQLARFHINGIKPKTFLRAYHEMTKNLSKSSYIPNFDKLTTAEKRQMLIDVFKYKNPPSMPHEIEYEFNRNIYKMVKELERDLGGTS
jgi:RNA-directed DNA polymerase